MNTGKRTHLDALKNPSAALNPGMAPQALIRKPVRVKLSETANANLRAAIKDKPMIDVPKGEDLVLRVNEPVKSLMELTRPLVLASASAGVLPGFMLDDRCFMKSSVNSSAVRLLQPNEIASTVREGMKGNPIVCDESDEERVEESPKVELVTAKNSIEDGESLECLSDFDPDLIATEGIELFNRGTPSETKADNREKVYPELDKPLRVDATNSLIKAKRRMESAFMDDYCLKMKKLARSDRPDYEGEYVFTVRVAVDDSNIVEVQETMTTCVIKKTEDEKIESEDDFKPDDDDECLSDVDERKPSSSRSGQSAYFDPDRQITRYNKKVLPKEIPVIPIDEKPFQTAEYHWLKNYEVIKSDSKFNRFLTCFRVHKPNAIYEFEGVRYRFLRVGTTNKLNTVRLYRQFVIGNNFTVYRLGMNGAPNVDIGMTPLAREKRFPLPINKKFTIASLFWANELLKSQKPW